MRRVLFFILPLFLVIVSVDAQAQLFKKKNKKKTTVTHKAAVTPSETPKQKRKKTDPQYPTRDREFVYRVDLILPLNLSTQVVNNKVVSSRTLETGTEFYRGVLIAADSMAKNNFKLELFVHDISDPANNVNALISGNKLNGSHLLIGLLQSTDVSEMAKYAKEHQVNFLSALSPNDAGIKDNPYFVLLQPTLETHVNAILEYSYRKFLHNPKFLIYRDSSYADDAFNLVKQEFRKSKEFKLIKYTDELNLESYKRDLSTTEVNVIYCTILDTKIAYGLLKRLSALGSEYKFEVFGMPSWKAVPDLNKQGVFPNLEIFYTTPFFYDFSGNADEFAVKYKDYSKGKPSEFAYRGYELTYWMLNLLHKYGPVFNKEINDNSNTLFTRFNIEYKWDDDNNFLYLENKKLNILKYKEGFMHMED